MPRVTKENKEKIKALPKSELEKIVIKLASKKENFDYLYVNYFDKESGEEKLFKQAKADIDELFLKSYKGRSEELKEANMIAASVKRINEFTKVCKNKILEAELLMYVLEDIAFSNPDNMFGTCFTKFDYKVALVLKRMITLVTKKLHKDYKIDYEDKLNEYLRRLKKTSDHIDMIYDLPEKI